MQNFAAKSITGHRKYDSASESLKQLNLLNLKQRRQIHSAVAMHKILSTQTPANLYIKSTKLIAQHQIHDILNTETTSFPRIQQHTIKEAASTEPYMLTTLHQINAKHLAATPSKHICRNTFYTKHIVRCLHYPKPPADDIIFRHKK